MERRRNIAEVKKEIKMTLELEEDNDCDTIVSTAFLSVPKDVN